MGVLTKLICAFTVIVFNGDCARILGIVSTPSYSHQVAFQPIWRELSLRGHQVVTMTTNPINDPTLTNLTEIDVHASYDIWNRHIRRLTSGNILDFVYVWTNVMVEISHYQYSHPEIQRLIKDDNEKFDLVMVEINSVPMIVFAKKFNAPLVAIVSYDAISDLREVVGSPTHPILYPDPLTSMHVASTLSDRFLCVVVRFACDLIKKYSIFPKMQALHDQYFDKNYPPVEELANDVSLVLANSDPILHGVKPLVPTVVQFGGGIHRTAPKPLPIDLKKLLDKAENGFIYFSLGSNVKSKDLSESTREIMLQAFRELPYTVLWKFEKDDLPNKPNNVITRKWLPQQDVLKHPKIKLFITQGGLQSMEEGIYDHVPMIGMPFYADQVYNVHKMVSMGFGASINYKTMNKEELKSTIFEVINNPKYKNKIEKLAELALDQPMTGLEKAIWWTEYVIRHNGTKHLRSPILDIPFYQYYLLDVIAVFAVILVVLTYALFFSVKLLFKLVVRFIPYKKIKIN